MTSAAQSIRPLHVVFGGGQVGRHLVDALLGRGCRVRLCTRTQRSAPDDFETVTGDALDPIWCRAAASGASVIYHCLDAPYTTKDWARAVPQFADNLIGAAKAAGARLVVLDNVYALGHPVGGILRADAALKPVSGKGEIRARATERLLAADARGDAAIVIGRASEYYGPRGRLSYFGDQFWSAALTPKPIRTIIPLDQPHTYSYIPDVARALAELGTTTKPVTGRAWMLPCDDARTTRALIIDFAAALGRAPDIEETPRWMFPLLRPFIPFLRESAEMRYQWEAPFVVDDAPYRSNFDERATPATTAVSETIAWARAHYASQAGGRK
ncbi:MAG: NAD(P)H-binding protein [Gemmatimonas sp.]|nr:NAD(P)H-binding protein [Gemmatimonas sp.]